MKINVELKTQLSSKLENLIPDENYLDGVDKLLHFYI